MIKIPAPLRQDGFGSDSAEPLHSLGRREAVQRDVPRVARNLVVEPLQRPADADQPRALAPQAARARGRNGPCRGRGGCRGRRPRSAAPGSGRARPAARVGLGWRIPNGPRLARIAGEEAKRLGRIGEGGEGDDRADARASSIASSGLISLPSGRIAGDDRRAGAERGRGARRAPARARARSASLRRARRTPCAHRSRPSAQRSLWSSAGKGGDGTTMAVCLKSSDATTSGGDHVHPDQGPGRDSSRG